MAPSIDPTPAPALAVEASSNPTRPQRARRRLALILAMVAIVATACSSGPGSEQELVEILVRDETLSQAEAECIATAVFDEYGDDSDALGTISAAPDYEYLSGEDGVDGFSTFFEQTVIGCSQVGPTG